MTQVEPSFKCKRCGRELSHPNSVRVGYGPVCYEREFGVPIPSGGKPEEEIEYLCDDVAEFFE